MSVESSVMTGIEVVASVRGPTTGPGESHRARGSLREGANEGRNRTKDKGRRADVNYVPELVAPTRF